MHKRLIKFKRFIKHNTRVIEPLIFVVLFVIPFLISFTIPIGISKSVGLNDNGTIIVKSKEIRYGYSTKGVYGMFSYYNGTFYSSPIGLAGFSIQLNGDVNISLNTTLWIQDIARIKKTGKIYSIIFLDNIWNVTRNSTLLHSVTGHGKIYGRFYAYRDKRVYTTLSPFNVSEMVLIASLNNKPIINFYFSFQNKTYDTGWICFDSVMIRINSMNPNFIVGAMGGFAPLASNSLLGSFVLQFVVCGYSSKSQLYVKSWNSSMALFYRYNGSWYYVPEAFQVSPTLFAGGVTSESVNPYYGIEESYQNGIVFQREGKINDTELWIPKLLIVKKKGSYLLDPIPRYSLWKITVNNKTLPEHFYYIHLKNNTNITATLYAGNREVLKLSYLLQERHVSIELHFNACEYLYATIIIVILLVISSLLARKAKG
ncbi:MAG: thermopsin [Caldisphaeraceae archaeon]|nr:thermopsin [Caldisphaeraceae archaeon]